MKKRIAQLFDNPTPWLVILALVAPNDWMREGFLVALCGMCMIDAGVALAKRERVVLAPVPARRARPRMVAGEYGWSS